MKRFWLNPQTCRLTDEQTGRSTDVIIPSPEIYSRQELDEIVHWQEERAAKELAQPAIPQMTKREQNDLGQTLMEVRASKTFYRENNHGRYW